MKSWDEKSEVYALAKPLLYAEAYCNTIYWEPKGRGNRFQRDLVTYELPRQLRFPAMATIAEFCN